ncbi:T9SS type A sorting domain-containing protein [bacterium]|nr:T9SS type A sorting domain-containing protein [bacterium]
MRLPWRSSTSLVRLSGSGQLDAATWLGGPSFFGGNCLRTDAAGNVFVMGFSSHQQWFVTPGTLDDTLETPNLAGDSTLIAVAVVKLTGDYTTVLRGTYIIEGSPHPWGISDVNIDSEGNLIFLVENPLVEIPAVNSWYVPQHGPVLVKIDSSLQRYVFTTGFISPSPGAWPNPSNIAIDAADNIIISGNTAYPNNFTLKNALSLGTPPSFLMKFHRAGGEPLFSSFLPLEILEDVADDTQSANTFTLECNDIAVFGRVRSPITTFYSPLDTVQGPQALLILDETGQTIRSFGYWHVDEKYIHNDSIYYGSGVFIDSAMDVGWSTYGFVRNRNLTFLGGILDRHADSLSPLRAIQPQFAGGKNDLFLFRTRLPGCVMLNCSLTMADTVRIVRQPSRVDPAQMTITAEITNVDLHRKAGEVECVLTLPAGLTLDPANQSLHRNPPAGVMAPSQTVSFSWTVRVDTTTISGKGVWVDVVTYFRDADLSTGGVPSSSPCEHHLYIEYEEYGQLDLSCSVTAPDHLSTSASEDGYVPDLFPVHCTLSNDGNLPVEVARFGLHFGGDIGGIPFPASSRYLPGTTLAPGDTHTVHWQARAQERADARTMRVQVIGEDEHGGILSFCETEVSVPGLAPLQCSVPGPLQVFIPEDTTGWIPDPIIGSVAFRQVLDTVLLDVMVEIDLSSCHSLQLGAGQQSGLGPLRLRTGEGDTLSWEMTLTDQPPGITYDTILYRLESGGGIHQRVCQQIVAITRLEEGVMCNLTAPDTLTAQEVEQRRLVDLDYRLVNTGTLPITVKRYELTFDAGSGIGCIDPATKNGRRLDAGKDTTFYWLLRAKLLRNDRMARCLVTAYAEDNSVLSVCSHEIWIPGIEGEVSCELRASDTLRFNRRLSQYEPNPLPVTLTLTNPFDGEETGFIAEIDHLQAGRLALEAGETIQKSIPSIAGASEAEITWLLIPQPASIAEDQEIIVRYRSDEQAEWKQCSVIIHIEAWPEETGTACATGGHDSLYADPYYERFIPDPLFVSYTATNTGTIALTGCEASIVLPPKFVLSGSDSTQLFTSPEFVNQQGGPVPPGTLLPNASCTRWWMITPSNQLTAAGPVNVTWQWRSDQQGNGDGCSSSIEVVFDSPGSVVLSPKHLYFEAERGGPLPAAQNVQLWTGGGLSMPWSMQPTETWLNANPLSGNLEATVVVQPNRTMLDVGGHAAALNVSAAPSNRSIAVTYVIRKSTSVGDPSLPAALTLEAWPQPVTIGGMLQVAIPGAGDESYRLSLYDMLGRERLSRTLEAGGQWRITVSGTQFTPGSYILRVTAEDGAQVSKLISVIR